MIHSLWLEGCFFFFRSLDEKERLNSLEVGLEQSLLYGEVTRMNQNNK